MEMAQLGPNFQGFQGGPVAKLGRRGSLYEMLLNAFSVDKTRGYYYLGISTLPGVLPD